MHGFAAFLERDITAENIQFFGLADLYDYTIDAMGSGLNVGESGIRWAEVSTALETHRDLASEESAAVKAVGLLSAIGPYGELKPSAKVLQTVLGRAARQVCETLVRRSVVVYRKHSSSFGLWQGSDVDINERLADAELRVSPNASLAARITARYAPRPLVAKRHSFATGTLRYFRIASPVVSDRQRIYRH